MIQSEYFIAIISSAFYILISQIGLIKCSRIISVR
jgi:hypothetical protein